MISRKVGFTNTAYSKNRQEADYDARQLIRLGWAEDDVKFKLKLAKQKHINRLPQVKNKKSEKL